MIKKTTFLGFWLFICISGIAQNQYNVWYFGGDPNATTNSLPKSAGIDFNSGNPVFLTDCQMLYTEGVAVHCNSAGQMLFYANGDTVWDRNHNFMPNGNTSLVGNSAFSSRQSVLFLPWDLDTNHITMVINSGAPTSAVIGKMIVANIDMTLNGGVGDVSGQYSELTVGTDESMTAIKHINGRDYWVLTHLYGTNNYRSFLITPCGVRDTVDSFIGPVQFIGTLPTHLKASPMGDKVSFTLTSANITLGTLQDHNLVFDFDRSSGLLTGVEDLGSLVSVGNSFSPDGSKLYFNSLDSVGIYQFDMNASPIGSSRTRIGGFDTLQNIIVGMDMQIAPDGKIYVSASKMGVDFDTLFVIDNPNLLGTACNFDSTGINMLGKLNSPSFPNLITDYLNPLPLIDPSPQYDIDASDCQNGMTLQFSSTTIFPPELDSNLFTLNWNFGDPASGPSNIATGAVVSHSFSTPGSYAVTLSVSDGCRSFEIVDSVACTVVGLEGVYQDYVVYPVPAKNKVKVRGRNLVQVAIVDELGRTIGNVSGVNGEAEVDLEGVASNMLWIMVEFEDGSRKVKKIAKLN